MKGNEKLPFQGRRQGGNGERKYSKRGGPKHWPETPNLLGRKPGTGRKKQAHAIILQEWRTRIEKKKLGLDEGGKEKKY